jgi:hypothetical protein
LAITHPHPNVSGPILSELSQVNGRKFTASL